MLLFCRKFSVVPTVVRLTTYFVPRCTCSKESSQISCHLKEAAVLRRKHREPGSSSQEEMVCYGWRSVVSCRRPLTTSATANDSTTPRACSAVGIGLDVESCQIYRVLRVSWGLHSGRIYGYPAALREARRRARFPTYLVLHPSYLTNQRPDFAALRSSAPNVHRILTFATSPSPNIRVSFVSLLVNRLVSPFV